MKTDKRNVKTRKENFMPDDMNKEKGHNPGQSRQQSGQQQQKHDDAFKKNPGQDRNQEHDDKQKQQDQGGQRRAS